MAPATVGTSRRSSIWMASWWTGHPDSEFVGWLYVYGTAGSGADAARLVEQLVVMSKGGAVASM
ncbi:hypothetical protein NJ76_21090 [Rhodococcus sp. IITR03]|nr:hypothetical protein NJ76_21090 [Rhodococcus sp. IITR03]